MFFVFEALRSARSERFPEDLEGLGADDGFPPVQEERRHAGHSEARCFLLHTFKKGKVSAASDRVDHGDGIQARVPGDLGKNVEVADVEPL